MSNQPHFSSNSLLSALKRVLAEANGCGVGSSRSFHREAIESIAKIAGAAIRGYSADEPFLSRGGVSGVFTPAERHISLRFERDDDYEAMCDRLDALDAGECPTAPPSVWQPIETAPKDRYIWLSNGFSMRIVEWFEDRWMDMARAEAMEMNRGLGWEPTLWADIPKPPYSAATKISEQP